ncbi:MAG: hypothetical protein ABIQ44_14120, partial [Chloroflexia bacterium]
VGAGDNYLTAIDAISDNDVWSVGYYTGTGRELTLTQHWDGTQWSVVPSPNPGRYNNYIYGITAIGPNDVWAVGEFTNDSYYSASHLLTIHWNGTQWNIVPNPDPGGNYANSLYAAKGFTANDVWVTGFSRSSTWLDLRMHWDGSSWTVIYSPYTPYGFLYGIDGLSANNMWAVGSRAGTNRQVPMTQHFVGGSWNLVSAPAPVETGDSQFYGVGMVSDNDVWAVGAIGHSYSGEHSFSEHWNGSTWELVATPDKGKLAGVEALAADDVWAVGNGAFLHWDGADWGVITNQSGGELAGIDALAANNMWAVGTKDVGGVKRTVIEHYTPTCATETPTLSPTPTLTPTATPCVHTWTEIPSQNVGTGDNVLKSVSVIASDDVWAVGYYTGTNSSGTLTQHWDGIQWNIVPSPNEGQYNVLRGVSASASNDVWAVGSYGPDSSATTHLLTIHWDGSQWNVVTNPDPGGNDTNYLNGVESVSSNNVWAVGFYSNTTPLELILHWDGVEWTQSNSPMTNMGILTAVDGKLPDDVWAAGRKNAPPSERVLLEHWNGSSWSTIAGGFPGLVNHIAGVAYVSTNRVWAAGDYVLNGIEYSMVLGWDGSQWSIYSAADVGALTGIKAITEDNVWAIGERGFLKWDGVNWRWILVPNPVSGILMGIDEGSADDMWAVGSKDVGGTKRALIERYLSECTPRTVTPTPVVPTPTVTRTGTSTPTRTGTMPTATNTP